MSLNFHHSSATLFLAIQKCYGKLSIAIAVQLRELQEGSMFWPLRGVGPCLLTVGFGTITMFAQVAPSPLSVDAELLNAKHGTPYTKTIHISGGRPPYKVAPITTMPEMDITVAGGNTVRVQGTCKTSNTRDTLEIDDSSASEVSVPFFCEGQSPLGDLVYKSFIGLQQSQASSSDRTWKLFANLGISAKVFNWSRFLVELDATSIPQQVGFNVSQVTTKGPSLIRNLNINEAVQSLNLLTGFELPNIVRGSPLAIQPIALGGFSTPLSPKESLAIYTSTQDAFDAFGKKFDSGGQAVNTTTYPYIALTTPDRSRFYSQWYSGVRIKIFDLKGLDSTYNGYFDVTFGQNAAITGGQLRHFVWRFSGFVPIPKTALGIFGSAYSAIEKNRNSDPLFLSTPSMPVTLPNPQTLVVAKAENRDFYQLGFAIDLITIGKGLLPTLSKLLAGGQ